MMKLPGHSVILVKSYCNSLEVKDAQQQQQDTKRHLLHQGIVIL